MAKVTHKELIKRLEQGLIKGLKLGFLDIGEALYLIKENQTFKNKEGQNSFNEFCLTTKDPLPGNSPASRKIMAHRLIKIYELLLKQAKISKEDLIRLGHNKCYEIALNLRCIKNKRELKLVLKKFSKLNTHEIRKLFKGSSGAILDIAQKKTVITYYDSKGRKINVTENSVDL